MAAGVAVNSRYMWITYKHIFAGKWLVSEFFVGSVSVAGISHASSFAVIGSF